MKKLFIILTMLVTMMTPAVALAATPADHARNEVCKGVNDAISGSTCSGNSAQTTISNIMKAVLNILSWVAGIAAVIMIVLAGLKYITSGGDSSSIASAKTSLIYALVGIVVVAIAQSIVFFAIHTAKLR